jgi:hypothetical protein
MIWERQGDAQLARRHHHCIEVFFGALNGWHWEFCDLLSLDCFEGTCERESEMEWDGLRSLVMKC